jgi:hypothetical protein
MPSQWNNTDMTHSQGRGKKVDDGALRLEKIRRERQNNLEVEQTWLDRLKVLKKHCSE